MNENMTKANSRTFQTVLDSSPLMFVDFYADWCRPCKMIASSIDKLAEEYGGSVKFVKLNIDESPDIATRYRVTSIPTLMIFRKGEPIRRMIGASPIGHYRGELQKVISKTNSKNQVKSA